MGNNKPLRSLHVEPANWFAINYDFGRDEAFCLIEDETIILAAAGLMVAGQALCLSKDDNWLSRNEVFRVVIPGSKETKMAAAEALCSVDLWTEEERGGIPGWRLGVDDALQAKRDRHNKAQNAAKARYSRTVVVPEPTEEENPF